MYRNQYNLGTIHAEENAIRKLPTLPRKSRLKKVDILVIRTTKDGNLGCSKPCMNCLLMMKNWLPDKGYTLGTVYFSDDGGTITHMPFHRMYEDRDHAHVSRFYKGTQSGK
jgi:cytidine deaminase